MFGWLGQQPGSYSIDGTGKHTRTGHEYGYGSPHDVTVSPGEQSGFCCFVCGSPLMSSYIEVSEGPLRHPMHDRCYSGYLAGKRWYGDRHPGGQ